MEQAGSVTWGDDSRQLISVNREGPYCCLLESATKDPRPAGNCIYRERKKPHVAHARLLDHLLESDFLI
ncbi:hypothetical protein Mal15_35750 [Stieleria maiorica]|uniref:Uncharacterized protein n=1 Tax=Stieleria maiorica TaxID=2795974 RepID=A0A5B9MHP0_9BACT|nr:hypothetical protein Mal15_35750 [Stieleria maiorica]